MRELVHEYWPVVAVTLFTTLLVLQIPRRALFPSLVEHVEPAPFASFVEYGDADYAALVQDVRMAWQVRARSLPGADESRTGVFDFDEPLPAPRLLPLTDAFFASSGPAAREAFAPCPLLPPTLALSGTAGIVPAAEPADTKPRRDPALLELPDFLNEEHK